MSIARIKIIELGDIRDERGALSVIEKDILPFEMKRVYYLYDVPSNAYRGGHAHINQYEFLIAISGSFNVVMQDAFGQKTMVTLNKPNKGLLIPNQIWRELDNFSAGAVCLVIASDVFIEEDYIRDIHLFLKKR